MINKDTQLYGSFSDNPGNNGCMFFNKGFKKHKIDAIYKSFHSTDIKKTIGSVKHLNFSGFALSMPLKIEVIPYLDVVFVIPVLDVVFVILVLDVVFVILVLDVVFAILLVFSNYTNFVAKTKKNQLHFVPQKYQNCV